jgi:hypothetical protein
LIVDGKSISTVLNKKFDSNELPLTTTRQEIITVYTNRDIKKLVSNELLRCTINSLAAPTGIGALDRRPKSLFRNKLLNIYNKTYKNSTWQLYQHEHHYFACRASIVF